MTPRKKKSFASVIIITIIFIIIIIYLFTNLKQEKVQCNKIYNYDSVTLKENIITYFSGNKIEKMTITKKITLDEKYADEKHINQIKSLLDKTLNYLDDVKYSTTNNSITVTINATGKEVILLRNIEFIVNDDLVVKINSNTKSSNVISLTVGDNYTESEFMTSLKNKGYTCN